MKHIALICLVCALSLPATALAQSPCDAWEGTWDVLTDDGSYVVWEIDTILVNNDPGSMIVCYAYGTSTPAEGGTATPFMILNVSFFDGYVYSESLEAGQNMSKHSIQMNDTGDAFVADGAFSEHDVVSGTKRGVSGPRCSIVSPTFAMAGDQGTTITVNAVETSFAQGSTDVVFDCDAVTVTDIQVVSATELLVTIDVDADAVNSDCDIQVTTGDEVISCGFEIIKTEGYNRISWTFDTGNLVQSSPCVDDERVYIGSGDGNIYCLNAAVGQKVWEFTTGTYVSSSPVVVGDYVYVGSNDKKVYCIDVDTGTQVWAYETGGEVQSSPAVVGNRVYVGSYDNKVYCLDARTGRKIWEYESSADIYSTPTVYMDRVYVGGVNFELYCLDARTGRLEWMYLAGGDIPPSPAVYDGKVYAGSEDHHLHCLDAITGEHLWQFETQGIVFPSAAIRNGRVYVGSIDGMFYCLDAANGSKVWDFDMHGDVHSAAAVTGDYVYVGSHDGKLYCLNALTGAKVWAVETGGPVFSSPAVENGYVYFGSNDGTIYCVSAQDNDTGSWPMFQFDAARSGCPEADSCVITRLLGAASDEVQALRTLRDRISAHSAAGRLLVSAFYRCNGVLARLCDRSPLATSLLTRIARSAAAATD